MTLQEREANTYEKFNQSKEIKKKPIWSYIEALSQNEELSSEALNLKAERGSSNAIVQPGIAALQGADISNAFGLGVLQDAINWGSESATLARQQTNDIKGVYLPRVIFFKTFEEDYETSFQSVSKKIVNSLSNQNSNCYIFAYNESIQYANAYTYHRQGDSHFRRYVCDYSDTMNRTVVEMLSAKTDNNKSKLYFTVLRINGLESFKHGEPKNGSPLPDMRFELFNELEPHFDDWYALYSGHDEQDNFRWKSIFKDIDGVKFEVPQLEFADQKQTDYYLTIAKARQKVLQENNGTFPLNTPKLF